MVPDDAKEGDAVCVEGMCVSSLGNSFGHFYEILICFLDFLEVPWNFLDVSKKFVGMSRNSKNFLGISYTCTPKF